MRYLYQLPWSWTYKLKKDCENCPPKPKPELVQYAKETFVNSFYEYHLWGNGSSDYFNENDGYLKDAQGNLKLDEQGNPIPVNSVNFGYTIRNS